MTLTRINIDPRFWFWYGVGKAANRISGWSGELGIHAMRQILALLPRGE
jgi:hypothetical protein